MQAVAVEEPRLGMRPRQTAHQLARIHAHPGELVSHAVGGIQGNRHSIPYCFILRYRVVRPIRSSSPCTLHVGLRPLRSGWPLSGIEITGEGPECTNSPNGCCSPT